MSVETGSSSVKEDDAEPHIANDPLAGAKGETLEQCTPLSWPGIDSFSPQFISTLIARLLAASYRPPELIGLFALTTGALIKLLTFAREAFAREANIVDIIIPANGRVHVFGDTHGDLHSLIEGLRLSGWPSKENILCFAGDCVDRGSWGVEVLVVLMALKLWRPQYTYVLRGNHETSGCIARYGFEAEVMRKYDVKMLRLFMKMFRELPCAAVIRRLPRADESSSTANGAKLSKKKSKRGGAAKNFPTRHSLRQRESKNTASKEPWSIPPVPGERRVLVVHGGLFRSWKSAKKASMILGDLNDLAEVPRRSEDPYENILEDVLWSDPQIDADGVCANPFRGAGILFGKGAAGAFFKKNHIHGLIRAHEGPDMRERRPEMADMCDGYSLDIELVDGYVATVFSSAQYPPDKPRSNKGAFATLYGIEVMQQYQPQFTQFEKQDSPEDAVLFYNPPDMDSGATPRNSIS